MEKGRLDSFGSVMNWKTSLIANSRKGTISDKNWDEVISQLETFMKFIESGPDMGMTPDELLDEGLRDPDKARNRLMGWFNWMKGGSVENYDPWTKEGKPRMVSHNSSVTYLGRVRGFYTHNKVIFGKWKMPSKITSKTSKADSRVDIYKYDEMNGELYVDTPILQQFLANLNFRDQTIALALNSTSQDPSDLLQLTIGWLREQNGEKRLFWEDNRNKTGEPFKVFFTKEATDFIRRYVKQKREGALDSEAIWVLGKKYSYQMNGDTIDVGGAVSPNAVNVNFRMAGEAMGITENGKPNPMRPKRFRHLFRTACTSAGLDPGVTQAFMGHKTPVSDKYLSQGKGFLLSQYVLIEPFLTVFKSRDQNQIQNFRADLNSARRERDNIARKLGALEKEVKKRFGLTEDELKAIYFDMNNIGLGGGKALKPDFNPLTDLDDYELDKLFIRALRLKMVG